MIGYMCVWGGVYFNLCVCAWKVYSMVRTHDKVKVLFRPKIILLYIPITSSPNDIQASN